MTKRWLTTAAVAISLAFAGQGVAAEADYSGEVDIIEPRTYVPLNNNQYYYVRYECSGVPGIPTPSTVKLQGSTHAHGFYITEGPEWPRTSTELLAKPEGVIAAGMLFALDDGEVTYQQSNCEGEFIVNGSADPNLMAFFVGGQEVDKDLFTQLGTLTKQALPFLSSVLLGVDLPQRQIDELDSFNSVMTTLGTLASKLDFSNQKSTPTVLGVGTYKVLSRLMTMTVTVSPQGSFLLEEAPFIDTVGQLLKDNQLVKQTADQVAANNAVDIHRRCADSVKAFRIAGFDHPVDAAFMKVMSLTGAAPTRSQILHCLGETSAEAFLDYQDYAGIDPDLQYSAEDIYDLFDKPNEAVPPKSHPVYGVQPHGRGTLLKAVARMMIRDFPDLSSNTKLVPRDLAALTAAFAPTVTIEDDAGGYNLIKRMISGDVTDDRVDIAPDKLPEVLAKLNLRGWGCYAETNGKPVFTEEMTPENEPLILLAWPAAGREQIDEKTMLGVRVFFEGDKVRHIVLTNAVRTTAWVTNTECEVTLKAAQNPPGDGKPAAS